MVVSVWAIEIDLGSLTPEQIQMYQQYQSGGIDAVKASMGGATTKTSTYKPKEITNTFLPSGVSQKSAVSQEESASEILQAMQDAQDAQNDVVKNPFLYQDTSALLEKLYAKRVQKSEKPLERFSARFFRNANTLDAQATPIPSYYIMAPQDVVGITLYGAKTDKFELTIDRNGNINVPKYGPIKIASLDYQAAVELVTQKLQKAFVNTDVVVDVVQFATIQVMMTGDVKYPGLYNLSTFSTIKDALVATQGVGAYGSVRAVELHRAGKKVEVLDLYRLMKFAEDSHDVLLRHGDILHVPKAHALVTLEGEVVNPAIYELRHHETFETLLEYASGLKANANTMGVRLTRFDKNRATIVKTLSLAQLQKLLPQDGDTISFFSLSKAHKESVAFYGNIAVEGARELPQNGSLRTLLAQEGITLKNFFLGNTHFETAIIKRRDTQHGHTLVRFDLQAVLSGKRDVTLHANDELYIFNKSELKTNPYIYVEGSVIDANASKYQYFEGMTLGDLMAVVHFKNEELLYDGNESVEIPLQDAKSLNDATQKEQQTSQNMQPKERKLLKRTALYVDHTYIRLSRAEREGVAQYSLRMPSDRAFVLAPFDSVTFFDYYETHTDENISLVGEFNKAGSYPYREGMTLGDALALGAGLSTRAHRSEVELVRYHVENAQRKSSVTVLNIDDANVSMPLMAGDEVYVRSISNWNAHEYITLKGEVRFPGVYQFQRGEKLSNVIARAGGFMPTAFVKGAVFTRKSIQKLQEEELKKSLDELNMKAGILAASANKAGETSADKMRMLEVIQSLTQEAKNIKPIGRITMALNESLEMFKKSPYDITLEHEDVLYIPTQASTVTLVGEVLNTNSFVHIPHQTVWDYIHRGGGLKEGADEENIYIVKANGDAVKYWRWFFIEGNHHICKGDVIIVPKKLDVSSGIKFAQDLADIGYKLAITVASLKTIGIF
ncbi:MAG: hypothetical protein KU37_06170 [Sulfuricurvum sp. PC08-66]|nr:MAG: hypothetical protein KU37_06170 [Sulfuricurvum sp. PC08-66]